MKVSEAFEFVVRGVAIGVGATVVMDLWALFLRQVFGVASLDYAFVGRWLGHLPSGRLTHPSIAQARPVAGEGLIGWTFHYVTGVVFAAALLAAAGPEWGRHPSLWPALVTGWLTILAPFLILQPGLGLGVAAARTPKPNQARARSLMTHTIFGLGLFVAAALAALVYPGPS